MRAAIPRDHCRRQLTRCGQQPVAMRPDPFAFLVELADHARPHIFAPVVELLLELVFDDLPLFLDHENLFKSFGKTADRFRLERPRHRHLEQANADFGSVSLVDAEVIERLADIEIRLAAADDAEARLWRIDDDTIQIVRACIVQRRVNFVIVHPRFLHEDRVGPADVDAVGREWKVGRRHNLQPLRIDADRRRRFDGIGDALERYPATRIAAHRPAMQSRSDFRHRRRIEHRYQRRRVVIGLAERSTTAA